MEARYAPPGSLRPNPLDYSGDYGREVYRLTPEAVDCGSFEKAAASLKAMEGFQTLLEHDFPGYGKLVYGETGEEAYLFFLTSAGVRYRLHLPAIGPEQVPLDPEEDYGRADRGEACVIDGWSPYLVDWITGCVAFTNLGNGELRRMGEARWTLYLPAMEEFVYFRPYEPVPLSAAELRYREVSIGDTVEDMLALLGEPEEVVEHLNTSPEPPQDLEHRDYRYAGAVFREAYTEDEGWLGVIGQIEIWDTSVSPGPRGILIGETPVDVMNLFPREYDYTADPYSRFYGLSPYEGAGGCAYLGPEGEVETIVLTPESAEPFLRIEFREGKLVRIFMGYSWI